MVLKNPLTLLRRLLRSVRRSSTGKREFTRAPVSVVATLMPVDGPPLSGYVTDISMKGLFLACAPSLPLGTVCQVTLLAGARSAESSSRCLHIEVTGKVARATDQGVGIEFTAIEGKDSFEQLRSLLLIHSPEGDRVEGEIQTASWSYETQVNFPTSCHNTRPTARHSIKRTSRTS